MLDSRMRRLLFLLAGAAAVAGIAVALSVGLDRLQAARQSIALHTGQIKRLQESLPGLDSVVRERDALKAEVDRISSRFYAPGETDPYAFGTTVRRKLTSLGITVQSYQLVDVKGQSYIEFTVTGSARAFVLFLRDVSQSPRAWSIPTLSLSVRQGTQVVDASFRIGYVVGGA